MLPLPPLWLQKHTHLRARDFAHSPCLWRHPRLINITCAWSWKHFEINPAITNRSSVFIQYVVSVIYFSYSLIFYFVNVEINFLTTTARPVLRLRTEDGWQQRIYWINCGGHQTRSGPTAWQLSEELTTPYRNLRCSETFQTASDFDFSLVEVIRLSSLWTTSSRAVVNVYLQRRKDHYPLTCRS